MAICSIQTHLAQVETHLAYLAWVETELLLHVAWVETHFIPSDFTRNAEWWATNVIFYFLIFIIILLTFSAQILAHSEFNVM